jgi:hypothetical protein
MAVASATEVAPSPEPAPAPVPVLAPSKVTSAHHLEAPLKQGEPAVDLTAEDHGSSSGVPTLTYVLAGTGIAALGAGAALIYWGRKDNSQLTGCSTPTTNCDQATIDHIHNFYLGGNIALGVGLASLGAAYWVYAHNSGKEESSKEAYRFDVLPTRSGAVASVGGSF